VTADCATDNELCHARERPDRLPGPGARARRPGLPHRHVFSYRSSVGRTAERVLSPPSGFVQPADPLRSTRDRCLGSGAVRPSPHVGRVGRRHAGGLGRRRFRACGHYGLVRWRTHGHAVRRHLSRADGGAGARSHRGAVLARRRLPPRLRSGRRRAASADGRGTMGHGRVRVDCRTEPRRGRRLSATIWAVSAGGRATP
jgi:hypothetical protein